MIPSDTRASDANRVLERRLEAVEAKLGLQANADRILWEVVSDPLRCLNYTTEFLERAKNAAGSQR